MNESEVAFGLRCAYYYMAEQYDRTVCTASSADGNALPASLGEYTQINRHAMAIDKVLRELVKESGIDHETWKQSKDWALRLTHEQTLVQANRFGQLARLEQRIAFTLQSLQK